jgi:hypothetical protein
MKPSRQLKNVAPTPDRVVLRTASRKERSANSERKFSAVRE